MPPLEDSAPSVREGSRNRLHILWGTVGLALAIACLMLFLWATERGRAALGTVEPWFAAIVVAVLLFPHLIWLDIAGGDTIFGPLWERLHSQEAADTNLIAWLRLHNLPVVSSRIPISR